MEKTTSRGCLAKGIKQERPRQAERERGLVRWREKAREREREKKKQERHIYM